MDREVGMSATVLTGKQYGASVVEWLTCCSATGERLTLLGAEPHAVFVDDSEDRQFMR